jgi:hypothetical protein
VTRIISPEDFDQVFRNVAARRKTELGRCWSDSPEYTNLFLKAENCLLAQVAKGLNLEYRSEYWGIDAVMYERADHLNFPSGGWAEQLTIVIEHENEVAGAHTEINKLTRYNSPLKVLITYPWVRSAPKNLETYADIVRRADVFSDFTLQRRHLVLYGFGPEDSITWETYVYKLGEFVLLGGA